MHRDKKETCTIRYTYGDVKEHLFGEMGGNERGDS
jgi:hypothetical protein